MENLVLKNVTLPKNYHRIDFVQNESGKYVKQPSRIAFGKLPEWLKVETTQTAAPKSNGAETVIHGPQKGGKFTFYTGLRDTGILNWQYGNDYEYRKGQKSNSLCLFNFCNHDSDLKIYYFTGWYHHDRNKLEQIVRHIICKLLKDETAD